MQKFINYSPYRKYRKMGITTIQLSDELKKKIASFGDKSESYDKILRRIYSLAVKEQIRAFLMDDEGYLTIEEARKELNKKWPRSK